MPWTSRSDRRRRERGDVHDPAREDVLVPWTSRSDRRRRERGDVVKSRPSVRRCVGVVYFSAITRGSSRRSGMLASGSTPTEVSGSVSTNAYASTGISRPSRSITPARSSRQSTVLAQTRPTAASSRADGAPEGLVATL